MKTALGKMAVAVSITFAAVLVGASPALADDGQVVPVTIEATAPVVAPAPAPAFVWTAQRWAGQRWAAQRWAGQRWAGSDWS